MNNPLPHDNNRLLEDNKQVRKKVKQYNKKGRLKRIIAVLSVFVLLFTLNQLTFEADTLQRKAACGLIEHVHTQDCYGPSGDLICGYEEHEHTDACYQQRPVEPEPTVFDEFVDLDGQVVLASPMEEDIASETVDEGVSETTVELEEDESIIAVEADTADGGLEAEYDLDDLYDGEAAPEVQVDETDLYDDEPAPAEDEDVIEYAVDGETTVFLSDVIRGTGIYADDITAVGEIQDGAFVEDHISIEPVEGVNGEFVLKILESFDRIQLGIVTGDAIEIVWLTGGVGLEPVDNGLTDEAAPTDETEVELPLEDEAEPLENDADVTITDQILNSNEIETTETELKQTEVGELQTEVGAQTAVAELEAAAAVEQIEDAADVEDEQVDDTAPVDDEQVEDAAPVEDEQVEDAAPVEDEQVEDTAPVDDEQVEDAADVEDEQVEDTAPVEDEQVEDTAPVEDGQVEDASLEAADDVTDAQDEETVDAQDEEATDGEAEQADAQDEEATDEATDGEAEQADAQDEEATDGEAEQADAQDEEATDGEAEQADAQGDEAGQPSVIERRVRLDFTDYIATDAHTVYLFDETMNAVLVNQSEIAEADGVAVSDDDAQADGAPDKAAEADGEVPAEPAESTEDAQAEATEGAEASAEVVGATVPVLIITGDGEYALNGTVYTVAGLALPSDDASDEADATAAEDAGDGDPADASDGSAEEDETAPETRVEYVLIGYQLTYDLAEAEQYPLSLRELMSRADPVFEEREVAVAAEPSEAPAEDDGEAAEPVEGDAAESVEGEAAEPVEGDAAEPVEGDAAEPVENDAVEPVENDVEEPIENEAAEPVEGDAAEPVDNDAAESNKNDEESVEYNVAVLTVEAIDGDWLITPTADFDRTVLTVGRYEIALLNGRAQATYPAQTFEGATEFVTVHVEAPEGAFPAGTTMHLEDVVDEETLGKLGEPVAEGFAEVRRVHAVDITFRDGDGVEIEPQLPISVVMGVRETAEDEETTVVHMDSEGNAEVISAAQADAVAAEAPDSLTPDAAQTEAAQDEAAQGEMETAEAAPETAVSFTADTFSIYAVVVSKTLETKYLTSSGESFRITLTYTEEAQIPENATLAVRELAGEEAQAYLEKTEASLSGNRMVTSAHFFDIKIMNGAEEVQPAAPVEVKIEEITQTAGASEPAESAGPAGEADAAEEAAQQAEGQADDEADEQADGQADGQDDHLIVEGDPVVGAVHFAEAGSEPEAVKARETEEAVIITAESFSVYGVVYTVDFYYGNYEYHIEGESSVLLSTLFRVLGIEADASQATEVTFTNYSLVSVEQVAGDWQLNSLEPFTTTEALTVKMADGTVYAIRVEDALYALHIRVNDVAAGTLAGKYITESMGANNVVKRDRYGNSLAYDAKEGVVYFDLAAGADTNGDSLHYGLIGVANSGYRGVYWISNNTVLIDRLDNYGNLTLSKADLTGETTFVSYFAPDNAKLIIVQNDPNGWIECNKQFRRPQKYENWQYTADYSLPQYFYSSDDAVMTARPNQGYNFMGWYTSDGERYSSEQTLDVSTVNEDIILKPVFSQQYKYGVISNESGKAQFYIYAWGNTTYEGTELKNLPTEVLQNDGVCSFRFPVYTRAKDSGYEFVYWLRDDGTAPITDNDNAGKASILRGFGGETDYNIIEKNTTYVAFYKPKGDYLIRVNWPTEGGSPGQEWAVPGHYIRSVQDSFTNNNNPIFWYYYANSDKPVIKATADQDWVFDGWYHNGTELISTDATFNVYNYIYNNQEGKGLRDLNLTPVFKRVYPVFHLWFDGSNGIAGGDGAPNDTFYTRINGSGNYSGANSVLRKVAKNGQTSVTYQMPSASELGLQSPQGVGYNKFELKGWYDIYNKQYYNIGETVTITADTVFYADWAPSTYDIGQNSDVAYNLDTSSFITTRVYDYNNLFNMDSVTLNRGNSVIPVEQGSAWSDWNKEYWSMKGDSDDFIFMSTVSSFGRNLNPYGRGERNQDRETGTDGTAYTAIVTKGILSETLRNRLFSTDNNPKTNPGHRYVGSDKYLYNYDTQTGYYYYDSDKNAASYNQGAQRFYVYNYTNMTDKSYQSDKKDFLPFNYGEGGQSTSRYVPKDAKEKYFTETFSEPNYWFGMSSEIHFFLPNAPGYVDGEGQHGNQSVKNDDMVYKFAGDDDVWVFVDGHLVLDMGGIHGKVYGEINFSTGEWQVIGNGADKVDESPTIDYSPKADNADYILSSGNLSSFDIAEGDHTLTLYYLERGASQSNCAIYFNLAPRYRLQIRKKDRTNTNTMLKGATFGVYSNPECNVAADLNSWGRSTNEFTTGDDGIVHAQGLAAGHTYYIKELQAPAGYPDMSGYVITLTLDSKGNPTITVPVDAQYMVDTTGLEPVGERTYRLKMVDGTVDTICLPILNDRETSITSTKTWSLLDGKEYRTFEVNGKLITEYENAQAFSTVQIQRYRADESGTPVGSHNVRLVTQYYVNVSDDNPSNRDDGVLAHYDTKTQTVSDNGSLSFELQMGGNAGICSVVTTDGSLKSNVTDWTGDKPFMVNGSRENRPVTASYTVSGIQNDAVVYITLIGTNANSTGNLPKNIQSSGGTARKITEDTTWNIAPKKQDGTPLANSGQVTLSKNNGWTYTWSDLATADDDNRPVYYYVKEIAGSTPQGAAVADMTGGQGFIVTKSSDGLSGGIITVNNTLKAVKVKLRKRDKVKYQPDGEKKDVTLEGGEFYLYTEAEYKKLLSGSEAQAVNPTGSALINTSEMGNNVGARLLSDELGRFYTGFLPMGTYYIVEQTPPDGYAPLNAHYKVVIAEQGMGYKDIPVDDQGKPNAYTGSTEEALSTFLDNISVSFRKPGKDGIYNLYIDDDMKTGSIQIRKQWENKDEGKTLVNENGTSATFNGKGYVASDYDNGTCAVLLSLGVAVKGAAANETIVVDDSIISKVYAAPTAYGLTSHIEIVTVDGNQYIRLDKDGNTWPTLTVTNLPLKMRVKVTRPKQDSSENETLYKAMDAWYYIREVGIYDYWDELQRVGSNSDWTVTYDSTYTENDSVVSVDGHVAIRAKESSPDELIVINGMKGWVDFHKYDRARVGESRGNPVQGAKFKIAVDNNGGLAPVSPVFIDEVLISDDNGHVVTPSLPIGVYWLKEVEAPVGYKMDDRWYRLQIEYPEGSGVYLGDTNVDEVINPRAGALGLRVCF